VENRVDQAPFGVEDGPRWSDVRAQTTEPEESATSFQVHLDTVEITKGPEIG
jgi:hypothetical protein